MRKAFRRPCARRIACAPCRHPLGFALVPITLAFGVLMTLALEGMWIAMGARGFATPVAGVALSTLVLAGNVAILGRLLRHVRPAPVIAPSARLDAWLPDASFSDTIVVASSATRGPLMKALEELTLAEMPLARLLGAIRHLPARLAGGEAAKRARADAARPFLPMVSSGRGSLVLERAEDEIVLGTVGKLHQIRDQEPAEVRTPAEFRTFGVPNHERLAMSIRVVSAEGEAFLVLEHRTSPTDAIAEQRFARYWLAIRPGGAFVTRQLLRAVARRAERGASA